LGHFFCDVELDDLITYGYVLLNLSRLSIPGIASHMIFKNKYKKLLHSGFEGDTPIIAGNNKF